MKIFVDTAKIEEIEKAMSYGILEGVTTNPSLIKDAVLTLKKEGKNTGMDSYIKKILETAKGLPVSLEVIGSTYEEMLSEGKRLYEKFNHIANNVCIKIPVCPAFSESDKTVFDGIRVIEELSKTGIPVNCTLIFTPEQALLAAKAGARFVSPFTGRVDDFIRKLHKLKFEKDSYFPAKGWECDEGCFHDNGIVSGIDLVKKCVEIFQRYDIKTEVLAASLRNTRQVREAALVGADAATMPFSVLRKMLLHEKTIEGMKSFANDLVPEYEKTVRL